MKKLKNAKKTKQCLECVSRSSLVDENLNKSTPDDFYDTKVLGRLLKYLRRKKRKKLSTQQRETCPLEDATEGRVDHQVKLRCRQLTKVVQEVRKAIMRQDWEEATTLILILCHPGLKYYSSVIFRASFLLLCSHPNSSLELVQKFIRHITEYVLPEDINKFIRILFALRKSGLDTVRKGSFVRRTGDYKVVRDPEFEKL